jgi:predicted ribosome quality control (RQC) complex YloA/Tae2 family protein
MNDETIKAIVEEIAPQLSGHAMGKVFQLSRTSLAIDFRLTDGRYLFVSVDPALAPRLYLIARRVRELEKQALQSSSFVLALRKHLSGAALMAMTKDENDRIVRFSFKGSDEVGNILERTLVAQLTGRASNLLLLNEHGYIIDTLRSLHGEGQEAGEPYAPPAVQAAARTTKAVMERASFASLSEAADNYYLELEAARAFDARAARERSRLNKEIAQRVKLKRHLEGDLKAHGDAEEHRRIGDLLLANVATAERRGSVIVITDYYAEGAPQIELELDENSSLQEEAARRFARYTKARRASREIAERLDVIERELKTLEAQREELESIIEARAPGALDAFTAEPKREGTRRQDQKKKQAEQVPGARRYTSSDGYEILVGRAARDNDNLTFRIARPHDLWLHAADYPGSHVIVRNPTRAEIPHRTLIEAAQFAAHFSQARNDTKVTVHYTQRKFLSKPKGSAPGLVRMSSFRSITVEPKFMNREQ